MKRLLTRIKSMFVTPVYNFGSITLSEDDRYTIEANRKYFRITAHPK